MDVKPAVIVEAEERIVNIAGDVNLIGQLTMTDNLKYLTRAERERVFKRVLENMGALEDTLKAMIKAAREVRRARLRDDEQLSRMVVAMTQHALKVGGFETPPEEPAPDVKALYESPAPAERHEDRRPAEV
jgi:predicted RNase H-like nuclease